MFNWIILDHTSNPTEVFTSGTADTADQARADAVVWVKANSEDDYNDKFHPVTGMTGMGEFQLVVRPV